MTLDELIERIRPRAAITLTCEPEDVPIRGNALASGDDAEDRRAEEWIERQLASGNVWAWCCAHVRATLGSFHGDAYLGCCSYESREDFVQPDGYYPQLIDEALADLARQLLAAREALAELGL